MANEIKLNMKLLLRRGNFADSFVLAAGEPGYHITNKVLKIGDGTTTWKELPFANQEQVLALINAHKLTTPEQSALKIQDNVLTLTLDNSGNVQFDQSANGLKANVSFNPIIGNADTDTAESNTIIGAKKYTDAAKEELLQKLSTNPTREEVTQLPAIEDAKENVIYMIKRPAGLDSQDIYDEYILVTVVAEDGSKEKKFELLGNTELDLSNYYTKTQVEELIAAESHENTTYSFAATENPLEFTVTPSQGDAQTITLVAPTVDTGVMEIEAGSDIVVTPGDNGKVTISHETFTTGEYTKTPEVSDVTGDQYFVTGVTVDNGHVTGANVRSIADALAAVLPNMSFIFDGGDAGTTNT